MSENNFIWDPQTAWSADRSSQIGAGFLTTKFSGSGAVLKFQNLFGLAWCGPKTNRLWSVDPLTLSYGQVFSVERYSSTMNLSNFTFIVLQSETTFQQ